MRILMFGAGVINSIYGYVLAQAGHDVTHYVRPGKKALLDGGLQLSLLDGRTKTARQQDTVYNPKLVENFTPEDEFELVVVSVRHYQIESVLPIIKDRLGRADVLFFNSLWDGLETVDRCLPRTRYLWGFPVAGGGFEGRNLDGALLEDVHLGELDGQTTPRLQRIRAMFESAGLIVDVQPNMLHWLWVHLAINSGIIAAAFKAGGATELLNSIPSLHAGILAGREALAVCQARGVDVKAFDDAKAFYQNAWLGAAAVWLMMKTNLPARKIMETHTAVDELQHLYDDVLKTGQKLNVPMPHYVSLQDYVDHPRLAHAR